MNEILKHLLHVIISFYIPEYFSFHSNTLVLMLLYILILFQSVLLEKLSFCKYILVQKYSLIIFVLTDLNTTLKERNIIDRVEMTASFDLFLFERKLKDQVRSIVYYLLLKKPTLDKQRLKSCTILSQFQCTLDPNLITCSFLEPFCTVSYSQNNRQNVQPTVPSVKMPLQ